MEENIATDASEPGSEAQPENNAAPVSDGFSVPEEYREADWSKNIKSYDDLWKMNANAQSLIGQKTIGIPDEKSGDDEWNEFYSKTRPAKAEDYALELEGDDKQMFENLFYENGINARQASALIKGYKESVEKAKAPLFSKEGFQQEMSGRFGEKYDDKVKSVSDFIIREAAEADKAVLDKMPNNVLGIVYSLIDRIQTRYAVSDSDAGKAGGGKASAAPDWVNYALEAEKLKYHPHTTADIQALKDKFNIPYK